MVGCDILAWYGYFLISSIVLANNMTPANNTFNRTPGSAFPSSNTSLAGAGHFNRYVEP